MAEILATGTTSTSSSDVVVASGASLTVGLKNDLGPGIANGASVNVQLKADNGQYFTVDALNQAKPAIVIVAAGTYRFSRDGGVSCGVFSA